MLRLASIGCGRLLLLLALGWVVTMPGPGWAQQQPAAEVRTAVGVVFAQAAGGDVRILQAGARLAVGETVGTQKGAFAVLIFGDGSRVALRPETALTVRGFRYRPEDAQQDEMAVQLLQGWLRKVSGEIARRNPRSFEMRVGDATIGIRGTDFSVRICDEACTRERVEGAEGVLPQSRRLGQVVATSTPLRRQRGEVVDRADAGAMLMLGDVLATDESQAVIGLDDGARIVLAPRSVMGLRSVEDDLGRRAVRLDLIQGSLRVAAAPRSGARLYGLLVNAGNTVGLRPEAALDATCEAPAPSQAYACEAATVLLRQGRGDELSDAGARPLTPGRPERLRDPVPSTSPLPGAPSPGPAPAPDSGSSPTPVQSSAHPPRAPWAAAGVPDALAAREPEGLDVPVDSLGRPRDLWGGSASDAIDPTDVPEEEFDQPVGPAPASPAAPTAAEPQVDPLLIPVERSRPASVTALPVQGVYVAVFEGIVAVSNALGEVLVSVGQGAYVPLLPSDPPRALPASPVFMERDPELDRGRLYPEMCMR